MLSEEDPTGVDRSRDETDDARAAFKERLAAKGLQDLGTLLGQLAIHTADNLAKLSEGEWQDTLKLIPSKRDAGDLADASRYAPGHFSLLRQLRDDVLREATGASAACGSAEVPTGARMIVDACRPSGA